jgi:hypothetical protein
MRKSANQSWHSFCRPVGREASREKALFLNNHIVVVAVKLIHWTGIVNDVIDGLELDTIAIAIYWDNLQKTTPPENLWLHKISQLFPNFRYVDVTPTFAKIQISYSDITSIEGRSILHRCLQYI